MKIKSVDSEISVKDIEVGDVFDYMGTTYLRIKDNFMVAEGYKGKIICVELVSNEMTFFQRLSTATVTKLDATVELKC